MVVKILATITLLYGAPPVMAFYMAELATTMGSSCPRDAITPVDTLRCGITTIGDTRTAQAEPLSDGLTGCHAQANANSPGLWYKFDDTSGNQNVLTAFVTTSCSVAAFDVVLDIFDNDACTPTCLAGSQNSAAVCPFTGDMEFSQVQMGTMGREFLIFVSGDNESGVFEIQTTCA